MTTSGKTGFRAVVSREIRRMSGNRVYTFFTLILPLLAFGLLCMIFVERVPRELPVAVFDADNSELTRKIIRMVDATPSMKVAERVSDFESGKKLIQSGKAYGLVVFPKKFQQEAFSAKAPETVFYFNNQYLMAGSTINRDMAKVMATVSAGADFRTRRKRGEMREAAMAHFEPVRVNNHLLFNPYMNYQHFLLSALLPAILKIFVMCVSVLVMGMELKHGTAGKWLEKGGGSVWTAVAGKLAPYTLIFTVLGIFMNTILFRYAGAPMRGSLWFVFISMFFFVLACQAVSILFIAVTSNVRMSLSLTSVFTGSAFAFSGVTFPFMGMPLPAKIWNSLLPLTYYIRIVVDQSMKGLPVRESVLSFDALVVMAAGIPLLTMWRMKRIMTDNQFWGKV